MGFFHSLLNNIFFGIKEMLFFFYENANAIYLVSHFKLPIQKDNSGIRSMPMFNWRNKHSSLRQILQIVKSPLNDLLDRDKYENWAW